MDYSAKADKKRCAAIMLPGNAPKLLIKEIGREKTVLNDLELLNRKVADLEIENGHLKRSLQQSEERFGKLLHSCSCPMAITTIKEGRIIDLNEAYARFTGYKREELIGQTTTESGLLANPIQRNTVARKVQEEGKVHNLEVGVHTKTGDIRTALFSIDTIASGIEPYLLSMIIDITDRKNAEEELRESAEKYRILVENSLQGLAIIKDSRIVFCNDAYTAMTGYSMEELLSFPDTKALIHPDDWEFLVKRSHERLAGKPVSPRYEHRIVRKDGTVRWLEIFASLTEYRGKPATQIVHMDITERKQAENIQNEREEWFRSIAETIDEVFWISDAENKIMTYVSPAYERVWGYSRESLCKEGESFRKAVHPDDLEQVIGTLALMETGQPFSHEYRIIRPDGSIRHVWDRGFPILNESGRPKRYVGIAQDVTAWRDAEEALRESKEYLNQIINCIGDDVFVIDRDHKFVLVNDASCAFNGRRREELIGKTFSESTSKELALSLWERDEEVFRTGRENLTEDTFIDSLGNSRTMMSKKSLLTDKNGNKQIICVLRDVTEYKRLEAQFLQAQKMEAIGVLAGGVAHDFNNLLNVINGYSELILEDLVQDNPMRGDLEQVREAGQRAATLTSQLLAFSRKQILKPEVLDLNTAITEMSTMLRRLIGEDIDLVSITRPGLGLVDADPGQIQQIVMNLAVNARDAMPQGGKLTIETANIDYDQGNVQKHPIAKAGPYVMLAISDNGIGMDAATQAQLFEPFFTTKGKGKGTGLGLSTVYGIVKQSNGFIWVYSEPGKGTTFKIYLPRVQGEADKLSAGKVEPDLRGAETVLVVEDEASVRALTCRILSDRGYNVIEAADGMEAQRIAQELTGEIHLVLTDVVMPGINGATLISRLKAVRPGIKALYVSGYTDNAIVHHGMLDSNVAFLQKPFSPDGLARKVREVINS